MVMWVGFIYRTKYYFVWGMAESGLIFSGLCYNGRDAQGSPLWNKFINARIRYVLSLAYTTRCIIIIILFSSNVEGCTSAALFATNWNVATGLWLRHCTLDMPHRGRSSPVSNRRV